MFPCLLLLEVLFSSCNSLLSALGVLQWFLPQAVRWRISSPTPAVTHAVLPVVSRFFHPHSPNSSPVLWCAFTFCVVFDELVLCNRLFAVVGGLQCLSPLSFEKPEGNGGARFCESESRTLCAKEMVLGVGRTLTGRSVCSLWRQATLEGRRHLWHWMTWLSCLDLECRRYESATKLLSTSAGMCFYCTEDLDDWAEAGCFFNLAASLWWCFPFFCCCCSWAPRNADLQGRLYFDVQIHSSTFWTGRLRVNRNCLNV